MPKYNPAKIERKWQDFWNSQKLFEARDNSPKQKKYILVEFPYPSGEGLHMGHVRPYVAADVVARYNRAQGKEVVFPFGWDAFGLPAENYAIKTGVLPQVSTAKNIANARRQVISWGVSFDWTREVNTTDPEYYKWTQWIFLQFFKAGLAYEATAPINWCPKDKTGLANEEVIDGKCERCGTPVEKRNMRQWFLAITEYAQKLLDGLKTLDWPEAIKQQQENWIGRSEGAEIHFPIESKNEKGRITVYTTRPDTLFGVTYLVLAPEHPFIEQLKTEITNWHEVEKYIHAAAHKNELQRSSLDKEKSGVELKGVWGVHPATGEKLPVWIADYVLVTYGTGAIMAVPAHDERDLQFAKKFGLPVREVVDHTGTLLNSGEYDGLPADRAKKRIAEKFGEPKVQYKLRDWLFSRQRYWGEPIPLLHCPKDGIVAVPEQDLPVVLPNIEKYEPTGTGESPLAAVSDWVNIKCPKCGGPAKRETNTMPQWAGSSWYFLRFVDPKNREKFADFEKLEHWLPVDLYFGGMEHTTLHLLYSRFWNLFLFDQGLVPDKEPYVQRQPHGIILAADGEKMSKSRGNVVNPDDLVREFGADTMRMYELFLGPHEQTVSWNPQGIVGVRRFLDRAWNFTSDNAESRKKDSPQAEFEINRLIKKITEDINGIKFNTAVAALMEFMNAIAEQEVSKQTVRNFLIVLAPFAPHIAAELWEKIGEPGQVVEQNWPHYDESKLVSQKVEFVVQVNGKFRANLEMGKDAAQDAVALEAKKIPTVQNAIAKEQIGKVVFVPNRLINFVLGAPKAPAAKSAPGANAPGAKQDPQKNADSKTDKK